MRGDLGAAACAAAAEGDDARVVLEAPGGTEVPVPAGWRLRKVIGKGRGQPSAHVLSRA